MKNFKLKHLHDVHEDCPLVIIYTDIFLLQHQTIQRKILGDLGILKSYIPTTPVTTDDESSSKHKNKSEYNLTFEKCINPKDHTYFDGYALNREHKAGICSYSKGREHMNKEAISPVYFSWDYIEENYNKNE